MKKLAENNHRLTKIDSLSKWAEICRSNENVLTFPCPNCDVKPKNDVVNCGIGKSVVISFFFMENVIRVFSTQFIS